MKSSLSAEERLDLIKRVISTIVESPEDQTSGYAARNSGMWKAYNIACGNKVDLTLQLKGNRALRRNVQVWEDLQRYNASVSEETDGKQ